MSDPAERYAPPSPLRRPLIIVAVVLVAGVGLGWLVWAMLGHANPEAQSQLVSFRVRGEHRVDVRFTVVRRDREVEASCLLRAYASDHAVVAEKDVPVGPAAPAAATLDLSLRTERRATSVDLIGCTTADQPGPR